MKSRPSCLQIHTPMRVSNTLTALLPAVAWLGLAHADVPDASARELPVRWGAAGHEMAVRAAVAVLPADVPDFFQSAADQLVYLSPEPDRWRLGSRAEMRNAWAPDHYINFENVPAAALAAPDRHAYVRALMAADADRPDQEAGFLPFAIVELYQRLTTEWSLWRRERDPRRRAWIEERIVNDAGLLGHYVTDGSQPHHTTVHYNGWAEGAPNPGGFARDRSFHARFETDFVDAHVAQADVTRRVGPPSPVAGSARVAVLDYLRSTHARVGELYRLDRDVGFDPDGPSRPETSDFAAKRLAAGAEMLATLWLSAWRESR